METTFFDDDDSVTMLSHNDVGHFDQEMTGMCLTLETRAGDVTYIHTVMDNYAYPYDPFTMHMLQSDELQLHNEVSDASTVNCIQTSEFTFQVNKGSAMTATPRSHLV